MINKALRNLSYLNKFAQKLRDARFYQRRKNSKKVYNRKKIKDEFLTIKKLILK
tara:strand:- start:857 stop:1018 length:162 start_codon:yes stop_codon:yes gene_type:complete